MRGDKQANGAATAISDNEDFQLSPQERILILRFRAMPTEFKGVFLDVADEYVLPFPSPDQPGTGA